MTHNPLLPLFKEQLEAECKSLATKYELSVRGHFLIYWYFMRLHDFSDTDVEEIMCDGGGDLGIDALWTDDNSLVHFYQFKNPENSTKGVPAGDIDKMISGLRLILYRKHQQIANTELKDRLDDVYQQIPAGYRIHIISSGAGIETESKIKLNSLIDELNNLSNNFVAWDAQPLSKLQEQFYQQNLPAVKDRLQLEQPQAPYMLRSGVADCYLFSVKGQTLAQLYDKYKEALLQRNIRVDQRDTATNRSIEGTCSGNDSMNFLHFNNGVTFLCEAANYDAFKQILFLEKAQVVNGGQTIRAIHRAHVKGSLKSDVLVPARVITSSGDKDFANNVAVNQNNQNQIGTGFLRSNDQIVVQLDHALASLGWFLERREGELKSSTEDEKIAIQQRIGCPLEGRIIHLKDGAQAYTATFYGQPEIAKKNVKKIFLSHDDGGYYERIFSSDMTAEKMIIAHEIKSFVDDFVRIFTGIRRKAQASGDMTSIYEPALGRELSRRHSDVIHQVMPQCSLFVCGTIFKDLTEMRQKDPSTIPDVLSTEGAVLIQRHLLHIIDFAKGNKDKADKSWPVLLKSNAFFSHVIAYLAGIHRASKIRLNLFGHGDF
jgi:AIPR protein